MAAADNLKAAAILVAIIVVATQTTEAATVNGITNVNGITVNLTLCCTQNSLLCGTGTPPLRYAIVYVIANVSLGGGSTSVALGLGVTDMDGKVNMTADKLNLFGDDTVILSVRVIITVSLLSSSCSTLSNAGSFQLDLVANGPTINGILRLSA